MSQSEYESDLSGQLSPEKQATANVPTQSASGRGPSVDPSHPTYASSSSSASAPYRYLPKQAYTSIEYPGPVSYHKAILDVCSQRDIDECFNLPGSSKNPTLEMRYRPNDPSVVPVRGIRAPSQKLLLKVVRRRKKQSALDKGKGKEEGIFTAEVVGSIAQTVRFRSMADWHYTPNFDGPTATLVNQLKALDYNSILDFSFPPLNEEYLEPTSNELDPSIEYRSLLDLQPPPLFSSRNLPYIYNFKMPNQTVEEEVYDPRTGQTKLRYVNKARVQGVGPINIPFQHKLGEVPREPAASAKARIPHLDARILELLKQKFDERPVWMRHSLYNQFNEEDKRELLKVKAYVPCVAYIMGTGPFWKCLIRFGYDPCADPNARQYQRIFFYPNKRVIRNPLQLLRDDSEDDEREKEPAGGEHKAVVGWWELEQEKKIEAGERPPLDSSKEHVFDGQYLHRRRGDYQLCDVVDPLISKYINDADQFQDTCSFTSGFYTEQVFTLIKTLVRIKYMWMWEHGSPPTDSMCYAAIEDYERGRLVDEGDEDEEEQASD